MQPFIKTVPADLIVRTFALLGGATPVYWLAIVMLYLFHARLGWLPGPGRLDAYLFEPKTVTGMLSLDALLAHDYEVYWDSLRHLVLPAVVLGAFFNGAFGPDGAERHVRNPIARLYPHG